MTAKHNYAPPKFKLNFLDSQASSAQRQMSMKNTTKFKRTVYFYAYCRIAEIGLFVVYNSAKFGTQIIMRVN